MNKFNKFFFGFNVALLVVIVMVIIIITVAHAWTNPSGNPPSGGGALYYSGGYVGIGATSPQRKLDIEGNLRWGTGAYIGELDQVTNFVTVGAYSNHGLELQTNGDG